jgi:predicted  nucleic acid-binding Zn-ribbon protein
MPVEWRRRAAAARGGGARRLTLRLDCPNVAAMNETLQQFTRLAEIDKLIVAIREQLDGYPRMLATLEAAEADLTRRAEQARVQSEPATLARRAAEREVLVLREKIRKCVDRQSSAKSNKEFSVLAEEIGRAQDGIDRQETIGLEQLEAEEAAAVVQAEVQVKLAALREEHAIEQARVAGQVQEKRERLERLAAERAAIAERVDPNALEEYEAANLRNPGSACAALDGQNCSGCGWNATPRVQQAVHRGDLTHCEHCRRFLYSTSA